MNVLEYHQIQFGVIWLGLWLEYDNHMHYGQKGSYDIALMTELYLDIKKNISRIRGALKYITHCPDLK